MTGVSDRRRRAAWSAGYQARKDGKSPAANDRPQGTIYFDDWADGFQAASNTICAIDPASVIEVTK